MAYKQQKFISHSSGVWEAQDQGVSMAVFWWRLSSWFIGGTFLCPLVVEGAWDLSGASFIRANPTHE